MTADQHRMLSICATDGGPWPPLFVLAEIQRLQELQARQYCIPAMVRIDAGASRSRLDDIDCGLPCPDSAVGGVTVHSSSLSVAEKIRSLLVPAAEIYC